MPMIRETGKERHEEEFPGARQASLALPRRRWAVILAGGAGTRLQRLTRLICGDGRPKQFCPLVGDETLLEQTRKRAEASIPGDQTLFALTRTHRAFFLREPAIRPSQRIVQPANKGTAPPILYSLLSIEQHDNDAVVAILPCDHHYSDEPAFTSALESAFDIATEHSDSVVLLGATPRGPETEYGWIELGPSVAGAGSPSFHVRAFSEKPTYHVARLLFEGGSLWNTFVMVGHVRGFLQMMDAAQVGFVDAFRKNVKALSGNRLWAGEEAQVHDSLYDRLQPVDFSREILSRQPQRLVTLRLDANWNDLGHPERVMDVLKTAGLKPWWMRAWQITKRSPAIEAVQESHDQSRKVIAQFGLFSAT